MSVIQPSLQVTSNQHLSYIKANFLRKIYVGGGKKKKRRPGRGNDREKERSASPQEIPIDPDEPTYCLCDQV